MDTTWPSPDSVAESTYLPTSLRPGVLLGETYRVLRLLGEGGMGAVFLARDDHLAREVAVKVVRADLLARDGLRERFQEEARAMARVSHRNVVQVFAFGEHDGAPYFVMERMAGPTLQQWLAAHDATTPPGLAAAKAMLDQICDGISAIHAARTVHHDLKPANVLTDGTGRVAVSDLGLALALARAGAGRTRGMAGTAAYMAPEVATGNDVPDELAPRADIYALGCLAFELFTGKPPFAAPTDMSMLARHLLDVPTPPSTLRAGLPRGVDDVILRALEKDPARRMATAELFKQGIENAFAGDALPGRILIAEDEEDFRTALEVFLAFHYPLSTIEGFGDGAAALEAFTRQPYDLVLLDLQMPVMDGLTLARALRQLPSAERTPIVVLTASGGPEDWRQLTAIGADGFLVKPVNLEDVLALVRRSLRVRRSIAPPPPGPPPRPAT